MSFLCIISFLTTYRLVTSYLEIKLFHFSVMLFICHRKYGIFILIYKVHWLRNTANYLPCKKSPALSHPHMCSNVCSNFYIFIFINALRTAAHILDLRSKYFNSHWRREVTFVISLSLTGPKMCFL